MRLLLSSIIIEAGPQIFIAQGFADKVITWRPNKAFRLLPRLFNAAFVFKRYKK